MWEGERRKPPPPPARLTREEIPRGEGENVDGGEELPQGEGKNVGGKPTTTPLSPAASHAGERDRGGRGFHFSPSRYTWDEREGGERGGAHPREEGA